MTPGPAEPTGSAPVGYAHRGYSPAAGPAWENTVAAFDAAVELGYRHLETDCRVTADGVAVTFHDPMLDRLTNHTGHLDRASWQLVSQARVLGRQPIPQLQDVLGRYPEVHVNIDVKSHDAIGPTLDALRRTNAWHRVRLAAFSHRRLVSLRQAAGPGVASALSPLEVLRLAREPHPLTALRRQHPGLAAQVPAVLPGVALITQRFVQRAHAAGIEVHAWTVNDQGQMRRLLDLGVDAIITDRAELLRQLLIDRGQWRG